jgi:hypothetical protein
MHRLLACAAAAAATLSVACAAELDGVVMPDTRVEDGVPLHLNGMGMRTYSILRIRIYVAGLYLLRPNSDAQAILHSRDPKLLDIRFLRDVDEERSRDAWRDGLENACKAPCSLDPNDLNRFLSHVPAVHKGDESLLLFTPRGADITFNGQKVGEIRDTHFAELMLASFIGDDPPTPQLKRELLGQRD